MNSLHLVVVAAVVLACPTAIPAQSIVQSELTATTLTSSTDATGRVTLAASVATLAGSGVPGGTIRFIDETSLLLLGWADVAHPSIVIERPSVGLLNVGEEEIKGNETVKETAELLRAAHERGEIEFFGNVEGNDIFKGTVEVVVCDGFVGNVALKSSEGLAQMFSSSLKEEFTSSWVRKLSAFFAMPAVNGFRRRYDPRRFNGACLLGLNGLVVKSHGSADVFSYGCALNRAYEAVHNGLQEDIASRFAAQATAANSVPAVAAA